VFYVQIVYPKADFEAVYFPKQQKRADFLIKSALFAIFI